MKMNALKLTTLSLILGATSIAAASFEMALMVEGNRIVRYDAENRIALGSFGAGELGTYTGSVIAADPVNRGVVAVLNGDGGIRRFNAFTGRYLGSVSTGVSTFYGNGPLRMEILNNGNYLIAGYPNNVLNQVSRIYSPTGTLITEMSPFGSNYWALDSVQGSDGNIYTLNRISNSGTHTFYTFAYTSSGAYLGATSLGTSSDQSRFRMIGRAGNRILVTGNLQYEAVSHANGVFQTTSAVNWSSWSLAGSSGDIAWAHSRNYLLEVRDSGGGTYTSRLNFYDPTLNYMSQSVIDTPYTSFVSSMTMITAPEPGTMAALVAGFGLLMKRRKK